MKTIIDNVELNDEVIVLRDELIKQNDNYLFKPKENEWNRKETCDYNYLEIYFKHEPDLRVGAIGYYKDNKAWWVSSAFYSQGRYMSGSPENANSSIYMKNIIKIAKEVLKIPTMSDYKDRLYIRQMSSHIYGKQNTDTWELDNGTNHIPHSLHADMLKLHETGYKPISKEFQEAIEFLVAYKEKESKTSVYNPQYYNVWVRNSQVVYRLFEKDSPIADEIVVKFKQDLPQDILEKLVILDLMDIKNIEVHEGLGVKEKPDFYSVFA